MSLVVTGGCLCGNTRYSITFPPDFKPQPDTCQCNQCRKATGALYGTFLCVPSSYFVWTASDSLSQYRSSPSVLRGFCSACGSPMSWVRDAVAGEGFVDVLVGSLDERWLVERSAGEEGTRVALVDAKHHYWCENEIKGVTDAKRIGGQRFFQGRDNAVRMPDSE